MQGPHRWLSKPAHHGPPCAPQGHSAQTVCPILVIGYYRAGPERTCEQQALQLCVWREKPAPRPARALVCPREPGPWPGRAQDAPRRLAPPSAPRVLPLLPSQGGSVLSSPSMRPAPLSIFKTRFILVWEMFLKRKNGRQGGERLPSPIPSCWSHLGAPFPKPDGDGESTPQSGELAGQPRRPEPGLPPCGRGAPGPGSGSGGSPPPRPAPRGRPVPRTDPGTAGPGAASGQTGAPAAHGLRGDARQSRRLADGRGPATWSCDTPSPPLCFGAQAGPGISPARPLRELKSVQTQAINRASDGRARWGDR